MGHPVFFPFSNGTCQSYRGYHGIDNTYEEMDV